MTTAISVSVVVVSQGRPDALARCMTALTQIVYPEFEIVVVADKAGLNRLSRMAVLFERIKTARFDTPNISHARNIGVAHAAGEVVAFIDDSAVPEPLWLYHLIGPFEDPRVASAGGTVLGPDGITRIWEPRCVDSMAQFADMEFEGAKPGFFSGKPGLGIKTEATNMAFRRAVLAGIGGFDPVFHHCLEDADVNLRLAADNLAAALVPRAVTHQGTLLSRYSVFAEVDADLTEDGASVAAFLRKHAGSADFSDVIAQEHTARRQALLRHMIAGRIEPRDVGRILKSFDKGVELGMTRAIEALPSLPGPTQPFLAFPGDEVSRQEHKVVSGRVWNRQKIRRRAAQMAKDGYVTTAFVFSPTGLPHKVRFDPLGFWSQTGGLFGRSGKADKVLRYWRFKRRVIRETLRIKAFRGKVGPQDTKH